MSIVNYTTAGNQAHLARSSSRTEYGLIVLQEWWGLNVQIKKLTDRFSAQGFHAIAPDLYNGKVAANADEATNLMAGLDWNDAVEKISHCAKFLKTELNCTKVVVTGFCMGGALSFAASTRAGLIDAACPFYGIPPNFEANEVKVPIQAHFGKHDHHKGFSDYETATKLEEELKKNGKQ